MSEPGDCDQDSYHPIIGSDEVLLGKWVRVRRAGAQWKGEIVAISDGPALLIEGEDGHRVMVGKAGAIIELGNV